MHVHNASGAVRHKLDDMFLHPGFGTVSDKSQPDDVKCIVHVFLVFFFFRPCQTYTARVVPESICALISSCEPIKPNWLDGEQSYQIFSEHDSNRVTTVGAAN